MFHPRRVPNRIGRWLPVLVLLLAAPPATRAEPNWVPGDWMLQAVGRMMGNVLEVSRTTQYGYDDGISIMAAFLGVKDDISFVREIEKGQMYAFAGGGDNDVQDLDLEILDEDGRVIARDDKDNNEPVVVFRANYSGRCTIRMKLYDAQRDSFCVVCVLREGGWNVPKENLIRAAGGVINLASNVDRNYSGKVGFHAGSNQWALYGGIYRKGDYIDINNIALGTGRRVVVSAGDTQARDIDLYVKAGRDEAKDTQNDATPIVDVTADNVRTATLRIKNVDSGGPCLILTSILQLR